MNLNKMKIGASEIIGISFQYDSQDLKDILPNLSDDQANTLKQKIGPKELNPNEVKDLAFKMFGKRVLGNSGSAV